MKKLKSLWPLLIAPVIAGVIVEWVTKIDLIGPVWNGLRWFGHLFVVSFTLPVWGIILLMLAIPAVLFVAEWLLARRQPDEGYESYTSDVFYDIPWHWHYLHGRVERDIVARCPRCRGILDFHQISYSLTLSCQLCGFEKSFNRMDEWTLLERVGKEIDRKVATGEWKSVVQREP